MSRRRTDFKHRRDRRIGRADMPYHVFSISFSRLLELMGWRRKIALACHFDASLARGRVLLAIKADEQARSRAGMVVGNVGIPHVSRRRSHLDEPLCGVAPHRQSK